MWGRFPTGEGVIILFMRPRRLETGPTFGSFLLGALLLGCRSRRFGSLGSLDLLFFLGLLHLLDHQLDYLDFWQAVRAPAIRPAFLVLQRLDPFTPGQHVAGALQLVLATQTFINRHGRGP